MPWNWQQSDWPNFSWNTVRFAKGEALFVVKSGKFFGAFKHLGREHYNLITVEAMSTEAITTSEIEGEILNRESVQSLIRRQLGLSPDRRKVSPAEQGITEVMVDLPLRPIQVVPGAIYAPTVHFEAPPSADAADEMARFLDWFQRSTPNGIEPLPALTRAAHAI